MFDDRSVALLLAAVLARARLDARSPRHRCDALCAADQRHLHADCPTCHPARSCARGFLAQVGPRPDPWDLVEAMR